MEANSVIKAVCAFYKLTPTALKERSKVAQVVWPRHELIYMLRQNTNLGWVMIGRTVGGRDQSTVKNAIDQVTTRIVSDDDYAAHIDNLQRFVELHLKQADAPAELPLALARRVIGAPAPASEDIDRIGLCLLTAATILGNGELTDAEARRAALVVLGSLSDAA